MDTVPIESLVSRYFAAINAADFDAFDTILADDFVHRVAGRRTGKDGFKGFQRMFRAAFPDLRVSFEILLTGDDTVVVATTTSGTHMAAFLGHLPTRRKFTAGGLDVLWSCNGVIGEQRGEFDSFGMLQQLGIAGSGAAPSDAR